MLSTREAYGQALVKLADKYDYFVMDADLSKATQTVHFSKSNPDRFFNMGIAEANMMSAAAGMSTCGTPVVASTFAVFAAGRAYDQVRNSVAYPMCNVKIGATHGGILIGPDGGSHQCIEDIALMRALPNMVVLCPCDQHQTLVAMEAALQHQGPVYLRFGRLPSEDVYDETVTFTIGKGTVVRDGTDATIVAIGDMVNASLEAAKLLQAQGLNVAVLDMASVKPIDAELLVAYAQKTGFVVTAEDHNVMGGLGSAVSEVLSKTCPTPMAMVGLQDVFGRSGNPKELAEVYGLTAQEICNQVLKVRQQG